MSDYDTDILLWSEHQAELLRQHAVGARENDAIDWPNIIEEIESVGNEQRFAVMSQLRHALIHMLKAEAWPLSHDVPNWRADAIGFRIQAADRYTPSMRHRLDLDRIYRQALRAIPETVDGQPPLSLPNVCPVTLDELLSDEITDALPVGMAGNPLRRVSDPLAGRNRVRALSKLVK